MNLMNCGGSGGDNWTMNSMVVDAWVSSVSHRIARFGFHGSARTGPDLRQRIWRFRLSSGWQFRKDSRQLMKEETRCEGI